ncbi:MAG: alpha/beta hydrolase [Winogradskyella sp.]|uniref:alpha/beta fold hydrolase n=1 Tax=Winogradskyella sp. TaxID=1883156 RepID=UPI0025FCD724|nr:alpha/beta hydrolase [Winogradskyella sp.]NRB83316.1 alpha/beta hydrolase [Winogradskyella sp.]
MIVAYKNSTIYYTDNGEGPAVVLLHGFLETSAMWVDFIPELSKNNRVICIDLLGHGQTDCIGYVHTMEAMADALRAVLYELNIVKAKIIGHSMGGYVALALAEQEPALVESLCLMNSTFEADDDDRKALRARANEMVKSNFENMVRMSFANLFAAESKMKFKSAYESALEIALETPVQGYIAANEGMRLRPNRLEVFKKVKGKQLLILGQKDILISVKNLKSQTKDTKIILEELSEGHMSHIENKSDLSYLLLRFIEK